MAPLAAAIPVITAVGGLVGTGASLIQAFRKPPNAGMPNLSSPLMTTGEKKTNSNAKASLINTSPAGVLEEANTTRAKLLGQ